MHACVYVVYLSIRMKDVSKQDLYKLVHSVVNSHAFSTVPQIFEVFAKSRKEMSDLPLESARFRHGP